MNELLSRIEKIFNVKSSKLKRENFLIIEVEKDDVLAVLSYLKDTEGFKHLALLSCVDWIEKNLFQLSYILWNYKTKENLIVKIFIPRDNPEHKTALHIFPQIEIYEREIREMYGVTFAGNPTQFEDFALEGWTEIPPMRRDFDTLKYSLETYGEREPFNNPNIRDVISEYTDEWRKK